MKLNRGLGLCLAVFAVCVLVFNTATGCSLFQSVQPSPLPQSPSQSPTLDPTPVLETVTPRHSPPTPSRNGLTDTEATILKAVLAVRLAGRAPVLPLITPSPIIHPYDIVYPETVSSQRFPIGTYENSTTARFNSMVTDYDWTNLVHELVRRNAQPVLLTLPSYIDGYVIDYDGKYTAYFDGSKPGSFDRMRRENPGAGDMVEVSVPAYDLQASYGVVYIGLHIANLSGAGSIMAFKHIDNRTTILGYHTMWVS